MIDLEKINLKNAGFFRYKALNGRYLLTGDTGEYLFLGDNEFKDFVEGRLDEKSQVYNLLDEKNFCCNTIDKKDSSLKYRAKYHYLRQGTSLHIVIPTLRCNHGCIYCHAEARTCAQKGYDMDKLTARKVVDTIFESPNRTITIEFQGGEPLLNWEVVVYIINYALKKNRLLKKNLLFALVSNLTLMTKERLKFLLKNKVGVCTSLDGPKFLHDRNRPMEKGASGYELTTRWIKELSFVQNGFSSVLATINKYSLKYPKEIIREYLKLGLLHMSLRPVSFLGRGGTRREEMGITAEEFLEFYREGLDYIIELNEITGHKITDRLVLLALQKIFGSQDPGYLDMRSPCGAGCGQLAYFYDGSVYSCDEARMLGEDSFKLGNVNDNSYQEMMQGEKMKALVLASCTDGLYCDYCVYKPYCGVCLVMNWKECGSIYAQGKRSFLCKVYEGVLDYTFEVLQDKKKSRIIKSWINK